MLVFTIGASGSGRRMLLDFSVDIVDRKKRCIMFVNGIGQMHLDMRSTVLKGRGRFSLEVTLWNLQLLM